MKATTNIKHGQPDGSVVEFAPGEDVSHLDQDVLDVLTEVGSVEDGDGVTHVEAEQALDDGAGDDNDNDGAGDDNDNDEDDN